MPQPSCECASIKTRAPSLCERLRCLLVIDLARSVLSHATCRRKPRRSLATRGRALETRWESFGRAVNADSCRARMERKCRGFASSVRMPGCLRIRRPILLFPNSLFRNLREQAAVWVLLPTHARTCTGQDGSVPDRYGTGSVPCIGFRAYHF